MSDGMVIVFTGPSCSGKGVQSKELARVMNLPRFSTGEWLRKQVENGSSLGRRASAYMARGELVPNELVREMMIDMFNQCSAGEFRRGVILDGAIRERDNQVMLEEVLDLFGMRLMCVVHLEADFPVLQERMRHRDDGRDDDGDDEVFKRKYDIYRTKFSEVLASFRARGIVVEPKSANGNDIEATHNEIVEGIELLYMKNGKMVRDYTPARLERFFRAALSVSVGTDFHRRVVFLATTSAAKHAEFKAILAAYGVEVLLINSDSFSRDEMPRLFDCKIPNVTLLAIFTEHMRVVRPVDFDEDDVTKHVDIEVVDGCGATIVSIMDAIWTEGRDPVVFRNDQFVSKLRGHFDMSRKTSAPVYGWDDVFVVGAKDKKNGRTFHELRSVFGQAKVSPREHSLGQWVEKRLYYSKMRNFTSMPVPMTRPVDFGVRVYDMLKSVDALRFVGPAWNLITHVENSGVFPRAANQRRLGAFWCPGLNGGIPLTPKDDAFHELVYLLHDVFHFLVRDLIFTGVDTALNRLAYIALRMMSECFTMVLADMLVVSMLAKMFPDYDWSKRCIYPLFVDLKLPLDFDNPTEFFANLRAILHANYLFCLRGDNSGYKRLLDNAKSSYANLEKFENKYAKFFIGDFEWTEANYNNMVARADVIREWRRMVGPLMTAQTVDDVAALATKAGATDIPDFVFEHVFEHHIRPAFDTAVLEERTATLAKTFKNYMAGQMAIFANFSFVEYSRDYAERIATMVQDLCRRVESDRTVSEAFVLSQIAATRGVYEEYLDRLVADSLITKVDRHVFAEAYPMFPPHYITYKKDAVKSLASVAAAVFAVKPIVTDAPKTPRDYRVIMRALIEAGGGIVDTEGDELMFCVRPGVLLLSHLGVKHPDNLATVLIAGVCSETITEIVSHGEQHSARVTTSNTKAMDEPAYRVIENVTRGTPRGVREQKALIRQLHRARKEQRGLSGEIFNISNTGLKTSAIAVSFPLSGWHKFFIGRANAKSNEMDVQIVARLCYEALAPFYKGYLYQQWDSYVNAHNSEKYVVDTRFYPPIDDLETVVTPAALRLFAALGIDPRMDHFLALACFRAELTYLSFSTKPDPDYVRRIADGLGHRSIVRAYQGGPYAKVYQ